jgi:hypothetical protein
MTSFETANFFWHGDSISLYEKACLLSFLYHGFQVNVYSYDELNLPDGIKSMDAHKILPKSYLGKYTQAGQTNNLAAFSDVFRYKLLKKVSGWWFDMDVLCLKSAEKYSKKFTFDMPINLAYTDSRFAAGGVLRINNDSVHAWIEKELVKLGSEFEWGEIGPKLLTRLIQEKNLRYCVSPTNYFYPIYYDDILLLFDPDAHSFITNKCMDSYCLHLYNEFIRRWKIPKNLMPPKHSFLHKKFTEVLPERASEPTVPYETIKALKESYHAERDLIQLRKFKDKVQQNFIYKIYSFIKNAWNK